MAKYIVTGGTPLHGTITLSGAKNAGFKEIIASLLADSPTTIKGLGLISEINFAEQVIESLGGKLTPGKDPHDLTIDSTGVNTFEIAPELSLKSRFSPMYIGPLVAKFGKAILPTPGGDTSIGKRPIDRQLDGIRSLGAKIEYRDNSYYIEAKEGLTGSTFRFNKNTHNGTEVLVIAATKAKGTTIIENAAEEPEIDDLIVLLNNMGAQISRVEPRTIKIVGVSHLKGTTHAVMKDRNEAVTLACGALATQGSVEVIGADKSVLKAFLDKVDETGGQILEVENGIKFSWIKPLQATKMVTFCYPGFMTDWQPLWTTLMTQAVGESKVHETVYENRFDFVPGLLAMGANIKLFQPRVDNPDELYNFNLEDDSPEKMHAAKIFGPTPLAGTEMEIADIRSGATGLLAGMVAQGKTTIIDPKDQIKRGYEDLAGKLISLGAKIQVVES